MGYNAVITLSYGLINTISILCVFGVSHDARRVLSSIRVREEARIDEYGRVSIQ